LGNLGGARADRDCPRNLDDGASTWISR
jgi:hypothetical protein